MNAAVKIRWSSRIRLRTDCGYIVVKSYQVGLADRLLLQGVFVAQQRAMWQMGCGASHGHAGPTDVLSRTGQ